MTGYLNQTDSDTLVALGKTVVQAILNVVYTVIDLLVKIFTDSTILGSIGFIAALFAIWGLVKYLRSKASI